MGKVNNSRSLKLESCIDGPFVKTGRDYTADSWEHVERWDCTKNTVVNDKTGLVENTNIRRYVDWNDNDKFIPDWCPLPKS